jgi:hypothetical protein
MTTLVLGLVLGGTYALLALGLTLQYGIARIMNLAYGEVTLLAAFGLVFLFQTAGMPPLVAIVLIGSGGLPDRLAALQRDDAAAGQAPRAESPESLKSIPSWRHSACCSCCRASCWCCSGPTLPRFPISTRA